MLLSLRVKVQRRCWLQQRSVEAVSWCGAAPPSKHEWSQLSRLDSVLHHESLGGKPSASADRRALQILKPPFGVLWNKNMFFLCLLVVLQLPLYPEGTLLGWSILCLQTKTLIQRFRKSFVFRLIIWEDQQRITEQLKTRRSSFTLKLKIPFSPQNKLQKPRWVPKMFIFIPILT